MELTNQEKSGIIVFICVLLAMTLVLIAGCFDTAMANVKTIECEYSTCVQANEISEIRAIIGEASGEGKIGMMAVACGIRNRGHLKGVYGLKAKHVDKEPQWVWKIAQKAWEASKDTSMCQELIGQADHWESIHFKTPYWAKDMIVTAKIGNHIFYRKEKK